MTKRAKAGFFVLAVCTIACFAAGSIALAQGAGGQAALAFAGAVCLMGIGFAVKARLRRNP
ncbi:MAG: DUF5325 family protein [Alicyclobacillus sp.]|nr:DUF5325 family protein [Alicyclobacillus sp.]